MTEPTPPDAPSTPRATRAVRVGPLTRDEAEAVYDVLVEHAGATEAGREDFVLTSTDRYVEEYRFGGSLGFGGKLWRRRLVSEGGEYDVTAYPEDESRPGVREAVEATRAALRALPARRP